MLQVADAFGDPGAHRRASTPLARQPLEPRIPPQWVPQGIEAEQLGRETRGHRQDAFDEIEGRSSLAREEVRQRQILEH